MRGDTCLQKEREMDRQREIGRERDRERQRGGERELEIETERYRERQREIEIEMKEALPFRQMDDDDVRDEEVVTAEIRPRADPKQGDALLSGLCVTYPR